METSTAASNDVPVTNTETVSSSSSINPSSLSSTYPSTDEPFVCFNQSLTTFPSLPSSSLPSVTVSFNQLTVFTLPFILPYLRKIDISHNLITSLPNLSEYAPNIVSLNVSYNQLSSINGINHCTKLEQLRFETNQCTELESLVSTLRTCSNLRSIVGYNNPCFDIAQQIEIQNEQQLQEKRRHHLAPRSVPSSPSPSSSTTLTSTSAIHPSSAALLIIHACPDLRALVLHAPSLSSGPFSIENAENNPSSLHNSVLNKKSKASATSSPLGQHIHGRSQVNATAFTGMIDMSDGTGINAQTITKSCLLKITPDLILQAQSWYVNHGNEYLNQQKHLEIDYQQKLIRQRKEKEQQQSAKQPSAGKFSNNGTGSKSKDPKAILSDDIILSTNESNDTELSVSASADTVTKPPRIPLNQIKHKVPSRTVPSKTNKASLDSNDTYKRTLNNTIVTTASNESVTESTEHSNESHAHGDNENTAPIPTSPTTIARQALANFQSRKEGILAALAALPDFNPTLNANSSTSNASATEENSSSSSSLLITNALLPVGNIAGGLRRAAAALNSTSNPAYTSGRTTNGTKRKEDADIVRIVKNAKEITIPGPTSTTTTADSVTDASVEPGTFTSSTTKSLPQVISSCEVYRIDKDTGTLQSLSSPSSSSLGFLMLQDGTVHSLSSDETKFTVPIAVRYKEDGTLTTYWPNGALAIEINTDERTNRGLQKWSQQIRGASSSFSSGSLPKAFHLTAYSRETTGKNRNLAISWDGLGSGTICSTAGSTLLVNNEDGSGHHTDGKAKGSALLRAWNNPGNLTYTANTYQNTDLSIFSNILTNAEQMDSVEQGKDESNTVIAPDTSGTGETPIATENSVSPVPPPVQDSSIRQAKETVAAALAAAEATNAAIQAIMRTRALLTNHGLAGPPKEDFGKDPRNGKILDEQFLRQALLQVLFPDTQGKVHSYFLKHNTLPKALKSLPFYSNTSGIAFPIGQHLGVLVRWDHCCSTGNNSSGLDVYVFHVCNDVRFVVRVQPRVLHI